MAGPWQGTPGGRQWLLVLLALRYLLPTGKGLCLLVEEGIWVLESLGSFLDGFEGQLHWICLSNLVTTQLSLLPRF